MPTAVVVSRQDLSEKLSELSELSASSELSELSEFFFAALPDTLLESFIE